MKPRVFVSSVVEGFEHFRAAARDGIVAAGGEPVLVNEDLPSLAASSRNACLDAVDSSDIVLSIVGARGGWQAPSGKTVVEEEYDRARARKLHVLVFLQETERDAAATAFARMLSDYVDGRFRRTFATPDELRAEVERALRPLIDVPPAPRTTPRAMRDHFLRPYAVQGTTMLRVVLSPERDEEVIDPVRLGAADFRRRVLEIGHAAAVGLLSYEHAKTTTVDGDDLVVIQEPNGRHGEGEHVRLQISETGELVMDANVTGRVQRGTRWSMLDSMVVALEDIESILRTCFAFAAALYDDLDPYKRHQRFRFEAALSGLDHRVLERNPQPRASYSMGMRPVGVVRAFAEPRLLSREDLREPTAEIERVVELLKRRAAP